MIQGFENYTASLTPEAIWAVRGALIGQLSGKLFL